VLPPLSTWRVTPLQLTPHPPPLPPPATRPPTAKTAKRRRIDARVARRKSGSQVSPAVAAACSAAYTDTVISTNATSTTSSWAPKRSRRPTRWSWRKKSRRFEKIIFSIQRLKKESNEGGDWPLWTDDKILS